MASLEQLVQEWLDLDKVRICFAKRDALVIHCVGRRKQQGPRSRDYGNRESTRNLKEGSGIYLSYHPSIVGGEILFEGRESSLGPQV